MQRGWLTITRRHVTLTLLAIQAAASLLILVGQAALGGEPFTLAIQAVAVVVSVALLAAAWRDWPWAGPVDVWLITLLVGFGTPEPFVTTATALIAIVPPATALVLARPRWVVLSMLGVLAIYSGRAGEANGFWNAYIGDARTLGTVVFLVGSMLLSRLVSETALRAGEREAARADAARADAERQAAERARQAEALSARNQEQERLLALVDQLETPFVVIDAGVLLVPLIGQLDARRMGALAPRLLSQVAERRTRLAILDVTGIPAIDQQVGDGLRQIVQALRLIGCAVMLTGINAEVARDLVRQGLDLDGVETLRAPQDALARWRARDGGGQ